MIRKISYSLLTLLILLNIFTGCKANTALNEKEQEKIEIAVSSALIDEAKTYNEGECRAEGHITLGADRTHSGIKIYVLMRTDSYGFEDEYFTSAAGTIAPVLIRADKDFKVTEIEYPRDGSDYAKSIKRMMPKRYEHRALELSDADLKNLENQSKAYAKRYLKEIGRDAQVSFLSEMPNRRLLTDEDVSVSVSNKLCRRDDISFYPYWLGTLERIEDGTRYVYETKIDKDKKEILLTKKIYDTNKITQQFIFDSLTGNQK